MCQSAGLHRRSPGHVRCGQAEVRGQLERCIVYAVSEYALRLLFSQGAAANEM